MAEEKLDVKADSVLSRLAKAAESLVSLEIATVVADKPIHLDDSSGRMQARLRQIAGSTGGDGAYTRIDLLQGDVLNVVSTGFAPDEGGKPPVLSFHEQQVSLAKDIVAKNVETVTSLASAVSRRVFDLLNETSGR